MQIKKAARQKKRLRVAIDGPSGSGKTYSLERLAFAMKKRGLCSKILVIDTENESASLYVGESPDGEPFDFDTVCLTRFSPTDYTAAIHMGEKAGYDCIIIDSLSHAWIGEGGALDLVDQKSTGNSWVAWKDVTPLHRRLIDSIIQSPAHILASMRTKTEWTTEKNDRGKTVPVRIGTQAVQREGMEYEFDVYARCDLEHLLKIEKTRCSILDKASAIKPGLAFWSPLFDWLEGATAETPQIVATDNRSDDERDRDDFLLQLERAGDMTSLDKVASAIKGRGFGEPYKSELGKAYLARKEVLTA